MKDNLDKENSILKAEAKLTQAFWKTSQHYLRKSTKLLPKIQLCTSCRIYGYLHLLTPKMFIVAVCETSQV